MQADTMTPNAAAAAAAPTPVRMSLWEAFEHAQMLQRTEKFDVAESIYQEILQQIPEEPNTVNFLGVLRHQQGRTEEAIALLRRATELLPGEAGPWVNLGNVLIERERFDEAAEALRQAIAIDPSSPMVFNNFGVACLRCGDLARSESAFQEGLKLEPERSDLHFNYARLLYVSERFRESAAHSIRALTTDPTLVSSRKLLSMAYFVLGERDKAVENLLEWQKIDPNNPEVGHHLAACGGVAVPERAPDEYVEHVFDDFAASFDTKLQKLGYRAPQLVGDALSALAGRLPAGAAILDAGCGTGLCAALLRPHAAQLDGVDLSQGMLDRARCRGYDLLEHAELTAFLATRPITYDVIVSADTLCYFGDLAGFLSVANRALRGPGLLIFSLEALMDDSQDYQLHIHGRYSHSKAYVLRQLAAHGFMVEAIDQQVLRNELIESVQGWLVSASRVATSA